MEIDLESQKLPFEPDQYDEKSTNIHGRASSTGQSAHSHRRRSLSPENAGVSKSIGQVGNASGSAQSRASRTPTSTCGHSESNEPIEHVRNGSRTSRTSSIFQRRRSSGGRSLSPAISKAVEAVENGSRRSSNFSNHGRRRSSSGRSPSPDSSGPAELVSGPSQSIDSFGLDDEERTLFDFAEELRNEEPPGEPWFMEMSRLRHLHFLWLNKELACLRKKILEDKRASSDDMRTLQTLLRDQGRSRLRTHRELVH